MMLSKLRVQQARRQLSSSIRAALNYSKVPPAGVQLGRYIGDKHKTKEPTMDEFAPQEVEIRDARAAKPVAGFECRSWPTKVDDFADAAKVRASYYAEMVELVKESSGASEVFVFDHTIREAGAASLNAADPTQAAATVARVHTDYTAKGAPRRLEQLVRGDGTDVYDAAGNKTKVKRSLLNADFAFINVWRSIDPEHPVQQRPMAFLDETTVDAERERMTYELRFPRRTGETYALQHSPRHQWYYYPEMTQDECVVFTGFDKRRFRRDGSGFVYHTAFDLPPSTTEVPPRKSIEVRTLAFFDRDDLGGKEEPFRDDASSTLKSYYKDGAKVFTFYDMKHSNNAARIRLWLALANKEKKPPVSTKMIEYPDLKTDEFARVNPLRKVPALLTPDGGTVFESDVILRFLEDKFGKIATPETPEQRQRMDLMVRLHDLYVASPNCTAPGFSHSQGAMYLSHGFHGPARGMDAPTRAAKIAELWKQLTWLNDYADASPYLLAGHSVTLADLTWYPTCVFMEFMLPKVFNWPQLFSPASNTPTPKLAHWYDHLTRHDDPAFPKTRDAILEYWHDMHAKGQFLPILDEIQGAPHHKWQYP